MPNTDVSALPPLEHIGQRSLFSRLISRLTGASALNAIYKSAGKSHDAVEFASQALLDMRIECALPDESLARIPRTGRVIVVANHPFGALDALAAIRIIGTQRADVRLLANVDLAAIPELAPLILPLAPSRAGASMRNARALRNALRWLEQEHALVVFPAGEISHYDTRARCVTDPPWSPTLGTLVQRTAAPVVPLHFSGRNSILFQVASFISPKLTAWLLPSELRQRFGSRVVAHVGEPIGSERTNQFESPEALALHLRLKTLLAGARPSRVAVVAGERRTLTPVAAEMPVDCIASELARLPPSARLVAQGGLECWLAHAAEIPHTLGEVGRMRELEARNAGKGTGRERDLDRFDAHYEHLLILDSARRLIGACRLGRTDEIRRALDTAGLHSSTRFSYRDSFFLLLGPALEIGHTCVRAGAPHGVTPLSMLWKGIAEFVLRNPRYTRLIGTVSVGDAYQESSRHLLVDFLRGQRFEHLLGGLVKARHPPPREHALRSLAGELAMLGAVEPLGALVRDLEDGRKGVPVLLQPYLKLGARVLGFNAEPADRDAVDCLLLVDLRDTEMRELCRYMSPENAARIVRRPQRTETETVRDVA